MKKYFYWLTDKNTVSLPIYHVKIVTYLLLSFFFSINIVTFPSPHMEKSGNCLPNFYRNWLVFYELLSSFCIISFSDHRTFCLAQASHSRNLQNFEKIIRLNHTHTHPSPLYWQSCVHVSQGRIYLQSSQILLLLFYSSHFHVAHSTFRLCNEYFISNYSQEPWRDCEWIIPQKK